MKVLVSGSNGLIGAALIERLAQTGHEPVRLVRTRPGSAEAAVYWDPLGGDLNPQDLEGLGAVVHLAGESVAQGRWTSARRDRIRRSRVRGTRLLAETLSRLASPPEVLLSASAIGIYGNRGDEVLDETSTLGSGFLAEVCREWEAATEVAREAGIRVVNLRIGLVLAASGGALAKMLPAFRLGLGGRFGDGRQYASWITLDDLVEAICHLLHADSVEGPVNLVGPNPVTNRVFVRTLGSVLRRPALLPVPAFALRLALGQMAEELLLAGARVLPGRLTGSGYTFGDPQLPEALRGILV
jgi:hypothetical protein